MRKYVLFFSVCVSILSTQAMDSSDDEISGSSPTQSISGKVSSDDLLDIKRHTNTKERTMSEEQKKVYSFMLNHQNSVSNTEKWRVLILLKALAR